MVGALNVYETEKVLAPDYETDTRVFQSFQSVIREKDIPLIHPKPGETYQLGNASFTVLAPQSRSYSSANDYSVAIRLTAGDVSFLITGDAESESEAEMIKTGLPLESTAITEAPAPEAGTFFREQCQNMLSSAAEPEIPTAIPMWKPWKNSRPWASRSSARTSREPSQSPQTAPH